MRSILTQYVGIACLTTMFACAPPEYTGVSEHTGQISMMPVFTIPGALCRITRDGKPVVDFVAQFQGTWKWSLQQVGVDTSSHRDIVVTCSKRGFITQSKTVSVMEMEWYVTVRPCEPQPDLTAAEQESYCDQYYASVHNPKKSWGYPRVYLELKRDPAAL